VHQSYENGPLFSGGFMFLVCLLVVIVFVKCTSYECPLDILSRGAHIVLRHQVKSGPDPILLLSFKQFLTKLYFGYLSNDAKTPKITLKLSFEGNQMLQLHFKCH